MRFGSYADQSFDAVTVGFGLRNLADRFHFLVASHSTQAGGIVAIHLGTKA